MAAAKGRKAKAAKPGKVAKKAPQKQSARTKSKTDQRIDRLVQRYLVHQNGRLAAVEAGYSPQAARQIASELLARPEVWAKVEAGMAQLAKISSIEASAVIERLNLIATADPRELSELHRSCCRYCWGKGNRYQYKPSEMEEARAEYEAAVLVMPDPKKAPPFDTRGGLGFNPKKDPNPDCPECAGDGVERIVFKDTRDLSPGARLLFAGVKQTQHGLELKTHSQPDALRDVGRHVGAFRDKVELTGKDGGPVEHSLREIIDAVEGSDTGIGPASSRRG